MMKYTQMLSRLAQDYAEFPSDIFRESDIQYLADTYFVDIETVTKDFDAEVQYFRGQDE